MTAREFWEVWAKNFGSRGFHSLTKSTAFDFAEAYAEQVVSSKAAGAPGGQHILMPGEMSNDLLAPAAPSERGDEREPDEIEEKNSFIRHFGPEPTSPLDRLIWRDSWLGWKTRAGLSSQEGK